MELTGYKTYVGIFIAVLPSLLGLFGLHLVPGSTDQITSLIGELITVIGSVYAFYGRARAVTPGFLAAVPPVDPKA